MGVGVLRNTIHNKFVYIYLKVSGGSAQLLRVEYMI